LRVGVNYASKYKPNWLLFLDDDTILMNNAIKTALNLTALRPIKSRISSINLGSENGSCSVEETRYVMFLGLLIRFNIASKVCCRDDFFLDQADYDLGLKIRNLGYLTIKIDCKLIDHKLGVKRWVPIISNILHRPIDYEPPWRYYYIIRNSTRLLIEGRMDFALYMRSIN
jgi:rhamnosyltransferase